MSNAQTTKLVTITPKAAEKVIAFMAEEAEKPQFLRVYVQGGGCSGLSYGMGFEKTSEEDDLVIEENGVKMVIDSYSGTCKSAFFFSGRHFPGEGHSATR